MRTYRSSAAPVLLAVLLLTGCSAVSGSPSHTPSLPAPGKPDDDRPRTGPTRPKIGEWYRYDLFTHCGVDTVRFAGRWWKVSVLRTDLDSEVAGDPVDWGFNYTPGYMRLESDSVAVFQTAGQPPVAFRPTDRPTLCH